MLKNRCISSGIFDIQKLVFQHTQEAATALALSGLTEKKQWLDPLQRVNWQLKGFPATYNTADLWELNANSVKCLHNDILQYSKYCMLLCL